MLVNKAPVADMVLRRVQDATLVVVDVETSGLNWLQHHIIGWVLTIGPGPDDSYYIPVRHSGGGNLPADIQVPSTAENWDGVVHPIEPRILAALEGKLLVFHNGSFDMHFMHRVGWKPSGPIMDTMVAAFLTDEIRFSLSLEACCKDEGVPGKKGDDLYMAISGATGCAADKSAMGLLWRMDATIGAVGAYAMADGTATWALWAKLRPQLMKPYYQNALKEFSLEKVASVEFALMPILHKMSVRGIRIDPLQLEQVVAKTKADYEEGMNKIGDMNVRSPLQMRAYFEKHGETGWPLTEKGAPSFAEEWLLTTEPGKAIVKVRKSRTLLDNFLVPMSTRWMKNGRVHTNFHQTRDEEYGTRTGRLSTTDPNLGAMPGKRQGEIGKLFRSVFVPDEGMEFTESDYSSCEIRICAHYCKAKTWVDGFAAGIDPHTSVAETVSIIRRHAKTINLALMTGSGKKAIAAKLGLSYEEGSAIVDRYFEGLPELKRFQKSSADIFQSRGFISTLLGRRLQLADRTKGYTAVNRLTQGGNADIVKSAMVALDVVPGVETMLTVYDSALFQHEKGDDEAKMRAIETMADMKLIGIGDFSMPMGVEFGTGKNWGEATFAEDGKYEWSPAS